MYESIPKPPILLRAIPGHLIRVKLRTVGNLTQDEARLVGHLTFVSKRLSEGLKRQITESLGKFCRSSHRCPYQHAESNWSVAKAKLKKMKGNTNPNFLQEYLKEFMWHGEPHPYGSLGRLMQDIAEQYPL